MNRFEQQAERSRRASLSNSLLLWSAAGILLIAALALLGYSGGAPQGFWKTAAIVVAVLLLIVRQVGRRLKTNRSRAAKPDEQSMLHLD
jgi:4-hydroxybenzoate polyprenyltransferase